MEQKNLKQILTKWLVVKRVTTIVTCHKSYTSPQVPLSVKKVSKVLIPFWDNFISGV